MMGVPVISRKCCHLVLQLASGSRASFNSAKAMTSHFNTPLDIFEMERRRKVRRVPSPPYAPCCALSCAMQRSDRCCRVSCEDCEDDDGRVIGHHIYIWHHACDLQFPKTPLVSKCISVFCRGKGERAIDTKPGSFRLLYALLLESLTVCISVKSSAITVVPFPALFEEIFSWLSAGVNRCPENATPAIFLGHIRAHHPRRVLRNIK